MAMANMYTTENLPSLCYEPGYATYNADERHERGRRRRTGFCKQKQDNSHCIK